jgi:hypothetical protein
MLNNQFKQNLMNIEARYRALAGAADHLIKFLIHRSINSTKFFLTFTTVSYTTQ